MSNVKQLNSSSHQEVLKKESGLSVVKFGADWCGPCRTMEPILKSLAKKHDEVDIYEVNIEADPELAREYGVRGIPAVFLIKDGQVVDSFVGLKGEGEIEKVIVAHQGN